MVINRAKFTIMILLLGLSATSNAQNYHFKAIADFQQIDKGDAPYYVDKWRKALAINAGNKNIRNKFAKATMTFSGNSGVYDVKINAMRELDGECTYKLYINDELIGSQQNEETTIDYAIDKHVFKSVKIPAGAKISIESNTHSNGRIPEGDSFAWARGRWSDLILISSEK